MTGGGSHDAREVLPRLLERVVADAPDGVHIVDLDGHVVYSNAAAQAILGYSAKEMRGLHVDQLCAELEFASNWIFPEMRQQKKWEGEFLAKTKSGEKLPIWLNTSLVDDEEGNPIAIVGLFHDVTGQKRAEAALRERQRHAQLQAKVSLALVHDDPLDVVLQRCAEALVEDLRAALARIWTLDVHDNVLVLRASAGIHTRLDGVRSRVELGDSKIGVIARTGRALMTNKVVGDPQFPDQAWAKARGLRSFAGYPLMVEGRLAGVVAMFARHPIDDATLGAMGSVTNTLALGIARQNAESDLRKSEERFRSVFDESPLGMALSDSRHRLVRVNSALARMLRREECEVVGAHLSSFVHPADRDADLDNLGGVSAGERTRFVTEKRFVRTDGELIWLRLSASALHPAIGNEACCLGLLEDVSAEKAAEEALRDAKERAENADRAKSEFLDVASHELRTPLNALALELQLARTRVKKGVAVAPDLLERMLHQVDRMARMAGDLLDASRLDRGKLTIRRENVSLHDLVSATVDDFRKQAPARRLGLELATEPVAVFADATRLEQVLSNLIDNALKYTPDEADVEIHVSASGNRVKVSVTDTGPGIAADQCERLFTRFYRVKGVGAPDQPGLGLGLYICRVIVELHGGAIAVESRVGEGTTFSFTLPVSKS